MTPDTKATYAMLLIAIARQLGEDLSKDVTSARVDLLHAAGLLLQERRHERSNREIGVDDQEVVVRKTQAAAHP